MAIVVKQIHETQGTSSGSINREGVVTYQRSFRVYDDAGADIEEAAVIAAMRATDANLYEIHAQHSVDTNARVSNLEATSTANFSEWRGTVTWTNAPLDHNPISYPISDSPFDESPIVRITGSRYTVPMERDLTGARVANSAGASFDPLPEIPTSNLMVTIVLNRALPIELDQMTDYQNAINSTGYTLLGYQVVAGETLMRQFDAEILYRNGDHYARVTFGIEVANSFHWNPVEILDQGPWYYDAEEKQRSFRDEDGEQVQDYGNLNGQGGALPRFGTPVYLPFVGYAEQDFNALNLPTGL